MLQRKLFTTLLAIVAAGCGGKSPTAPPNSTKDAFFTAQLNGANALPPLTDNERHARGDVRITMMFLRGSDIPDTGAALYFVVNMDGFPPGSSWIGAHIHEGPPGVAGPVRVDVSRLAFPITNGRVTSYTATSLVSPAAGVPDAVNLINRMVENPTGFYFDVHTALNPTGAIRGPLVKQ